MTTECLLARTMTDERLDWHLANWADWMRRGGSADQGMPDRSSGLKTGGGSLDFDEMAQASDALMAAAVNAVIEDLPLHEQCAIEHRYLRSVWRFPRNNLPELIERARRTLRRRIMALGYDW